MTPDDWLSLAVGMLTLTLFWLAIALTFHMDWRKWAEKYHRAKKYMRVSYEQTSPDEKAEAGLFMAAILLMIDILIVAAR